MQAVATCRCQRAAPTLTTIFEIAALAAPLIRTSADSSTQTAAAADAADASAAAAAPPSSSSSSRQWHGHMHVPQPVGQVGHASAAPLKLLLLLSLRLARGWAPAVVLAQGVRLVGSVVQQRENKDEAKAGREGTEGVFGCCSSAFCNDQGQWKQQICIAVTKLPWLQRSASKTKANAAAQGQQHRGSSSRGSTRPSYLAAPAGLLCVVSQKYPATQLQSPGAAAFCC